MITMAQDAANIARRMGGKVGGLPNFQPQITPAETLARAEAVFSAVQSGLSDAFAISHACGFDATNSLARLVRDGRIASTKRDGRYWKYEVAK